MAQIGYNPKDSHGEIAPLREKLRQCFLEYDKHLASARNNLAGQRYDVAHQDLNYAANLSPEDPEGEIGLHRAAVFIAQGPDHYDNAERELLAANTRNPEIPGLKDLPANFYRDRARATPIPTATGKGAGASELESITALLKEGKELSERRDYAGANEALNRGLRPYDLIYIMETPPPDMPMDARILLADVINLKAENTSELGSKPLAMNLYMQSLRVLNQPKTWNANADLVGSTMTMKP
jgi:hypothetical protein